MTAEESRSGSVTVADATEVGLDAADEEAGRALSQARRLSTLLDDAVEIPVVGYRIGLDPIVGLLPVVGDLPAAAVAVYIVMEAAYLGVPRGTLVRMVLNVVVDAVVGSIPVVGPVFDAVWKANARNVALMEERLDAPTSARRDRRLLVGFGVAATLAIAAVTLALGVLAGWAASQVGLL